MTSDDDLPDYSKVRRTLTIDAPLVTYIVETTGNLAGTINRLLWDSLDHEIPQDGPETLTPNVRRRVLRIQREALKKEIHELQMMLERIEAALEDMEERPKDVWTTSVHRAIKGHKYPKNSPSKLVEASDPEPESGEDDDDAA